MGTVPTTKTAREEAIREILSQHEISSQSQLLSHLAERGIPTTQATLSRDLLALRATKVRDASGKTIYMLPDPYPVRVRRGQEDSGNEKLAKWCQDLLVSSAVVHNQVVLRTPAAGAQLLAGAIDMAWFDAVLGCIAGDDTILVICKTDEDAQSLNELFMQFVTD